MGFDVAMFLIVCWYIGMEPDSRKESYAENSYN